ncbi:hypothetical protein ERJ75_001279400 [Trypanosoma vivax]|nr:hypothetical protein ERJ75_001279400 [Trypanosoma vivax]
MNGRHTEADRRSLTNEAMIPQGLVRCEVCGHVHGASVRARRAHVSACGDYVPRKAAMARARRQLPARDGDEQRDAGGGAAGAGASADTAAGDARGVCWAGWRERPHNGPVDAGACGTKRYLHKKEWAAWLEVCRPAFLGYGASSQAERCRRQLVIMDLVRTHLAMGRGEAQRRRDAVAGQAARAAGARNGIPQDEGAQDEGVQDEDAQARRTAARVEMLCMLNAAGRAARMLTRDGEDLVRSSAAEVVREVDGLYPQEDVSTFPQPPLPVTVVGVEKDEVSRAIRRRLTRGAAPGLDGWTRELLYPLTQDSALLMEVTVLTADILNGNVSEQMAHRLRATALTILRKAQRQVPADRRGVRVGEAGVDGGI